ncbi:MAG: UDP-N-acetylmuramoyl-L-alanine--D-glutamate ligase [Gammaproteobacteria bacterium]|jgi:UDP-N-acetylmuramoylalanine--D-glutamate ligase|nr:UDP-N-acetylmuramoyl-L-alanine--D-glutamate ligase [Gammaproteobacteria bacterium]
MSAVKKKKSGRKARSRAQAGEKDLVLGLGATGLSVARFLKHVGRDAVFLDSREEPPGLQELDELWPEAERELGGADLPENVARVIVSPGIADNDALVEAARDAGLEVISDVELFAREAKAPFIGVTGSNGKSTVTTLLYHMCRAAGHSALAGGNLGEPALDLLAEEDPDFYVLELSSFQLQRTKSLPAKVAVLLNITPDHLDWHASEEEYREAKYSIFRDAESAVINREDSEAAERTRHIDRVISFGLDAPEEGHYGIRREDDEVFLARGDDVLLAVSELALFGLHNQANALAALAAGELLELDPQAMLQVLCEFPGLPHRMQFVRRVSAVNYVNDSKATNVAAAVASIRSVDGMLVLIAGGEGKGGDFSALAEPLEKRLRAAVLIGRDAEAIESALDTIMPTYFARDMEDAVQQAAAFAESDDTVLLAPACASFDQFENYAARGEAFCRAVEALRP